MPVGEDFFCSSAVLDGRFVWVGIERLLDEVLCLRALAERFSGGR